MEAVNCLHTISVFQTSWNGVNSPSVFQTLKQSKGFKGSACPLLHLTLASRCLLHSISQQCIRIILFHLTVNLLDKCSPLGEPRLSLRLGLCILICLPSISTRCHYTLEIYFKSSQLKFLT